ncbi:hypothetical protein EXW96_26295 [Paenibacillus sp. JMULE4]|uniref:hypothetical protein n=1 Tax=Paenibacillus sp. JMULE4 TaxID=2518342 RepID=UPI0015755EC0|nr:hypothetical protein [Paenibacillus sp. JMULE4]NTZ20900.1 hypothetical protein [Paenibacillus sp. JMULE4]
MLYLKTKLGDDVEIKIPLYDDEIYSQCPKCGIEHAVEPEIIAHIIREGDDFSSTSICCEVCSEKE